jgi:sigma-B regulation protein RsbU (phosphoserine phosphatase)
MPFPLLIRNNIISPLEIPGVPLGLLEGVFYEELGFRLEPGDALVLASDGATDALNRQGEFFDAARLSESIHRHSGKGTSECLKGLHSDLRRYVGDAELNDDVTLIALRRGN